MFTQITIMGCIMGMDETLVLVSETYGRDGPLVRPLAARLHMCLL